MDPLSALSLVGTIVQFVDFGTKLLCNAVKLYYSKENTLSANHELELATEDLQGLIFKLRGSWNSQDEKLNHGVSAESSPFDIICDEAMRIAGELLNRLEKLKVKDGKLRKWRSLKLAVEAAWSGSEISNLKIQLAQLKDAVETRILFSIGENLDAHSIEASTRFDKLDQQTQNILLYQLRGFSAITSELPQEFRDQMQAQTAALSLLVSRSESVGQNNHHQTREIILRCIEREIDKLARARRRTKEGKVRKDIIGDDDEITEDIPELSDEVQCSCAQLRAKPQTSSLKPLDEITASFELLTVSTSAESSIRKGVNEDICGSLEYPSMTHRYEAVQEAYPETFEWAFHDSIQGQRPWSNLGHWLRQDSCIYWVNGKAGSGKSIFMKHLFDDIRTRNYLKVWAGNSRLCVATFFFWNSGPRDQKSQSGLLRALLFQILSQQPDLIPIILPEIWAKTYSKKVNENSLEENFTRTWSLQRLQRAFRSLMSQKDVPLKICFIIDGLDEFDGEHDSYEALASLFKEITESPNIKACISSRPLVIFQDVFGHCPNLRLQNLTHNDIELYIFGRFSKNDAFQRLSCQQPKSASEITKEMVCSYGLVSSYNLS